MKTVQTGDILAPFEKIGYGLGDLAANLIFQTLLTFIAFFYTDVYKLPAKTAAAIIFFGGLTGACFNPVVGLIADRTQTRWGKFRPWILWTAVPFGAIAVLSFSTPNFAPAGKVAYATLTYVLLMLVYAANNLPYAALGGVLTGNMAERNSLSTYRFIAVMVAQFIIQVLLLPLVLILGDGNKILGFQRTIMVFACVGTLCFLITFLTTRERVVGTPEQRSSVREDVVDLIGNRPWVIMMFLTVLVFITLALRGGMYIYYFKNYLQEAAIAAFLRGIGFNAVIDSVNKVLTAMGLTRFQWPEDIATSGFSLFNAGGIVFMIIGIAFAKPLADRFGKRNIFGGALLLSTIFMAVLFVYPPNAIGLLFTSQLAHSFFYGITVPLLWAMIADVADYSEWKNNRRATALLFSAIIFGLKAGLSLGGALVAVLLSYYGYDSQATHQAPATVDGIRTAVSLYASVPFLLCIASLCFYEIRKSLELQIEQDLVRRRGHKEA